MRQEIKFPNQYNQCSTVCEKTVCDLSDKCIFGINRISPGARELRLDFNQCNLHCRLCWSNNNDLSRPFSVDEVFESLMICMAANYKYIYETVKPRKPDLFKIQSLQIIGGEPFISPERLDFIFEFINRLDNLFAEDFEYCRSCLRLDSKNRFKVKIFTNGVTIGNGEIDLAKIEELGRFNNIRIDLLVSVKGLYEEAFCALQSDAGCGGEYFEHQVACLEKLADATRRNLYVHAVLGFYHSKNFNIRAPHIDAKDMFKFDETPLSVRLYSALEKYKGKRDKGFFVEPIHALGKKEEDKEKFYNKNSLYLERSDLIEPDLKSNSKTNYEKTKLKFLLDKGK